MGWFATTAGNLARHVIRRVVRLYYPKIEFTDRERIPATGPVLFVANHANSLIDPVIIDITGRRPVHFLAKAPLFETPVLGTAMKALGMIPAFRGVDDPSQIKRNLESFTVGAEYLVKGEVVGLFPEGKSHDLPKVELVRSGATRIAIKAVQDGARDLVIVPLGINYERKERFRSSIWVRVGEPIHAGQWLVMHGNEERRAMRMLTQEIDHRLKAVVVHLNEEKWEPFLEDLEVLRPPPPEHAHEPSAALRQRKRIADGINYFLEKDRPRAEAEAGLILQHHEHLAAAGLTMSATVLRLRGLKPFLRLMWDAIWLSLGLVPALLGLLHHLLPFLIVRSLTPLLQTPGRSTIALTRLGLSLPIYALWYALVWWGMSRYFRPWFAWTWLAAMPLAGIFAIHYCRRFRSVLSLWWCEFGLLFRRAKLAEFRREQDTLCSRLSKLAEEYAKVRPFETVPAAKFSWRDFSRRLFKWAVTLAAAAWLSLWAISLFKKESIPELQVPAPELGRLTVAALLTPLAADEKALGDILHGLSELESHAVQVADEFASGQRSYYRQADNDAVRQLMLSYLNYRTALLRLVWKYQKHADVRNDHARLRAFLVEVTAGAALYEASLKFVTKFNRSSETVRKLNEAEPLWGIPEGLYDTVRKNLTRPEHRHWLETAFEQYRESQSAFEQKNLLKTEPYAEFHAAIARSADALVKLGPLLGNDPLIANAKEARDIGKGFYYRGQSLVSMWFGDTKIRAPREGKPLIRPEQLTELRAKLKPGDILLERRNWYLSNAFLPGYWPHSALYLGTPQELARMGLDQDPRVQPHWKAYTTRDSEGHEPVIIESVSEGVVFTSFEHSIGGADSAAFLRPRVPEARLREAIARAFSHARKPYDFEFDFFTTDKLVCTELVFRAYDGEIQFPLVAVLGRRTMPAIEMVRKFSLEYSRPDAQLHFVAFLDGDEFKGVARFRDEKAFIGTLQRPALTWLQGLAAPGD